MIGRVAVVDWPGNAIADDHPPYFPEIANIQGAGCGHPSVELKSGLVNASPTLLRENQGLMP
jgi:hypothetical protein